MTKEKLHSLFTNPPVLYTDRLSLRKIVPSDSDDMFDYSSREDVTRYLLWDPHPDALYTNHYVRYLQERYAAGDFYDFAIVPKSEDDDFDLDAFLEGKTT